MAEEQIKGYFSERACKGRVMKTEDNAIRYLDVLAATGNSSAAARAIGVVPATINGWKKDMKFKVRMDGDWFTFKELCEMADNVHSDAVESEAVRRAVEGYDEPIVYKGQLMTEIDEETGKHKPVTIRKYSDRLLEVLLKGKKPKYAGESQININAGENSGVLVVPDTVDTKSWGELIKSQQENARAGQPMKAMDDDEADDDVDPLG